MTTRTTELRDQLTIAIRIANEAHKDQLDKNGMPYMGHLMRVMNRGQILEEKIVGVLHDLFEDIPEWRQKWIPGLTEAGIKDAHVLNALMKLTRGKDEKYNIFVERACSDWLAIKVKLYDLEDNLDVTRFEKLEPHDMERINKYLRARRRILNGKWDE